MPLPWPEQRTWRVTPRGEGVGMRSDGESGEAEASESVIDGLNEKAEESADENVGEGALETITEVSSVDGGEGRGGARDVGT